MIFLSMLIVIAYASLLLWFLWGLNDKSLVAPISGDYFSKVSVIVAVRNEEKGLGSLLASLCQQSYPQSNYELIIVNDRSTDGTVDVVNAFREKSKIIHLLHITETPEGWAPKKWALNCAIKESNGELLLFTDGDCVPSETWIAAMIEEFSDKSVGFVSAPAPLSNKKGFIDDLFLLDSLAQDGFSAGGISHGIALSCTGRNMGIRRSVFDEVNGYEGIYGFISGDDDLLLQKVASLTSSKISFRLKSDAVIFSPPPDKISTFIHQRLRFASKGLSYYQLDTTPGMKMILPLLYITNIIALFSMLHVIGGGGISALLPWGLKSIIDGVYSYRIFRLLEIRWRIEAFFILSVLHPIYVTIFGSLGPFVNIQWKTNE
ncbi:MAG: glycosyltransferase [Candidatus Marinimicrobia bacterium]|nr:glycosyltransferase [Candidatus Neomarinimicrobiota bacterium]